MWNCKCIGSYLQLLVCVYTKSDLIFFMFFLYMITLEHTEMW